MKVSPAAVVIFAPVGRMSDVAWWVSVRAPANLPMRKVLAVVPNDVMVVVPVMLTMMVAAAPISVVEAEATSVVE